MSDLFTDEGKQVPTVPEMPELSDTEKNYLEELVGEGKKFKSPEDLAKGKAQSDMFIDRLKQELQGLREELNTRVTLEDFMDQMKSQPNSPAETQQATPATPEQSQDTPKSITSEEIESLVEKKLTVREQEREVQKNVQLVKETLQKEWGNDYVTKLRETAGAIGVGEEFLDSVAKSQPQAFFKLVGVGEQPQSVFRPSAPVSQAAPQNARNPASDAPSGETVKNQSYYERLKKTDPKVYWDKRTQIEEMNQAMRLGEDFFK